MICYPCCVYVSIIFRKPLDKILVAVVKGNHTDCVITISRTAQIGQIMIIFNGDVIGQRVICRRSFYTGGIDTHVIGQIYAVQKIGYCWISDGCCRRLTLLFAHKIKRIFERLSLSPDSRSCGIIAFPIETNSNVLQLRVSGGTSGFQRSEQINPGVCSSSIISGRLVDTLICEFCGKLRLRAGVSSLHGVLVGGFSICAGGKRHFHAHGLGHGAVRRRESHAHGVLVRLRDGRGVVAAVSTVSAVKLSTCLSLSKCGIDSFRELVRIQLATDILMCRQVPCIIFKRADFLRDSRDNGIVTHGMDIIRSKHNSTGLAVYAGYCENRTWSRPQLTVFVLSDRLRHGFRFCFRCVVLLWDFVS